MRLNAFNIYQAFAYLGSAVILNLVLLDILKTFVIEQVYPVGSPCAVAQSSTEA